MRESVQAVAEGYEGFLAARRARVLRLVAEAARRAGRDPSEVSAIAVSKTVGPSEVRAAWDAGWRACGENRPQEFGRKLEAVSADPAMAGVRFDMVGNLQKNKINQVVGRVALIHSISSSHLAEAVSTRAVAHGVRQDVLLEVNVSGEASKSGFSPDGLRACVGDVVGLDGIRVRGLMTMAPAGEPDEARRTFSGLRELASELRARTGLPLDVLSCGMSDDFQTAVEEGSTLVRLGRCVFDPGYAL